MGELINFPRKPIPDLKPRTGIPTEGLVSDSIPSESLVQKVLGVARRALGKVNTQRPQGKAF